MPLDFDDPDDLSPDELEDEGYYLADSETEYDAEGNAIDYDVYRNDEGDEVWLRDGVRSRNDILGFEDDDHFEDNLL